MVHSPPILVLDEPTAGVDIDLRQQLWDYVRELNRAGVTIVLTTHYLEEAEELCDRIAIINHGRLIANKPTAEMVGMAREKLIVLTLDQDIAALPADPDFDKVSKLTDRIVEIGYSKDRLNAGQVMSRVRAAGYDIVDVSTREPDLEDVFLNLTKAVA